MKALLLIDHGSTFEKANQTLKEIAKLMQKENPQLIIEIAHMELASPTIEQGIEKCIQRKATEITAFPYMLAPGRHASKDIPNMVNTIAIKHPHTPIKTCDPIGVHPKIFEIILERSKLD